MRRASAWFFGSLVMVSLIGCGGGSGIEEGAPKDMATAAKEADEQFRKMMGAQGDQMKKSATPPRPQ